MIEASRYLLGALPEIEGSAGDHVIALDWEDAKASRSAERAFTPFHELAAGLTVRPAPQVVVQVPPRRGYRFIEFLEWLVCSTLAQPQTGEVRWRVRRKQGAEGLERILRERGWAVAKSRSGSLVELVGPPPLPGARPVPASFETEMAGRQVRLAADWGAFSGEHVDDGTRLLLDAAVAGPPVSIAVDIGTGYGALALGLVLGGRAGRALGTELDSVALGLALINAGNAGVALDGLLEEDPTAVPKAELTVCNFPTHAQRDDSDRLLAGLAGRAPDGLVLIVVHASLEGRFKTRLLDLGVPASTVRRETHAVIAVGQRA
jgi:16S rRNA G1207 methylase RsmC